MVIKYKVHGQLHSRIKHV